MATINLNGQAYDTNSQSARADLRKSGYFIDNTGAYAPGAGARVGDTWSGANAKLNQAPNGNQLPVMGGKPVSPSNGFTGPNTGAIMYRGDPQYQSLFGQNAPGFSAAPTPWAPGGAWNGMDPQNYLGASPSAPAYQSGLASASAQTPFADYLKSQGMAAPGQDAVKNVVSLFNPLGNSPYYSTGGMA